MKYKIIRIIIVTSIIVLTLMFQNNEGRVLGYRVEAVGNLLFKYLGIKIDGAPLFEISDFKPGDCTQPRIVVVENNALTSSDIIVKSTNENDPELLSGVLSIQILEGLTNLYSNSLFNFFTDTDLEHEVFLSAVRGQSSTSYEFIVCFDESAGNEYQKTSLSFDLKFGEKIIPIDLPEVCDELEGIVTEVIVGTNGDDNIHGSTASELILAKGGNDRIHPSSGHDCVIAGSGNDYVIGTSGNEIVVGGPGNDRLYGGSGDDVIYGKRGEDFISGGSGNDKLYGNQGNDKIKGGSGEDELYGNQGNDKLYGGSSNDLLNGGPGNDILKGNSGNDTCTQGEILSSCEL